MRTKADVYQILHSQLLEPFGTKQPGFGMWLYELIVVPEFHRSGQPGGLVAHCDVKMSGLVVAPFLRDHVRIPVVGVRLF
jgi:hypothetical protein